jgi:hypothetical protein
MDNRILSAFATEFSMLVHFDIHERLANNWELPIEQKKNGSSWIDFRKYVHQLQGSSTTRKNKKSSETYPLNPRYKELREFYGLNDEVYNLHRKTEVANQMAQDFNTRLETNLKVHDKKRLICFL